MMCECECREERERRRASEEKSEIPTTNFSPEQLNKTLSHSSNYRILYSSIKQYIQIHIYVRIGVICGTTIYVYSYASYEYKFMFCFVSISLGAQSTRGHVYVMEICAIRGPKLLTLFIGKIDREKKRKENSSLSSSSSPNKIIYIHMYLGSSALTAYIKQNLYFSVANFTILRCSLSFSFALPLLAALFDPNEICLKCKTIDGKIMAKGKSKR